MSYTFPGYPGTPTGSTQPPTGPGSTQYPPGSYPRATTPVITPTDRLALSKFFKLRWGEYPKALPYPLPYTADQLADMFAKSPGVKATVEGHMRNQGHTHLFLGHDPTESDWADPQTFAALALWFANGTGDDLSRGEDMIRQLVVTGMNAYQDAGSGGLFPDLTGGAGGALTAGIPMVLALGLGLFFLTRPSKSAA